MFETIKRMLQLFADGGEGAGAQAGDAAAVSAPGESADAADQRLRELGVPEDKIRKHRSINGKKPDYAIRNAQPQVEAKQQDDAASDLVPAEEDKPQKATWEEILKDPDYNRAMQETVKAAKSKARASEEALASLAPALQRIAREHGMDENNLDYVALSKVMTGEYDQKAVELGVSPEIAMKLEQQERELDNRRVFEHRDMLRQQGEALKQTFPNFDLDAELENKVFFRMTAPAAKGGLGLPVETAYYAVHREEIDRAKAAAIKQLTQQQVANNIAAQGMRPVESGASGQAPSAIEFSWKNATDEQRKAMRELIHRKGKVPQGKYF